MTDMRTGRRESVTTYLENKTERTGYNGWKNYETWNVALWIGNDEGLCDDAKTCGSYDEFVEFLRMVYGGNCRSAIFFQTPDGVAWNDSGLDIEALDEMIAEL